MFSRIINPAVVRKVRLNYKSVLAPTVRLASGEDFPRNVCMDDCPVPRGDYEAHRKARDSKSNMILFGSIGFVIFSAFVAKVSGIVDLNYYRPSAPLDE